MKIALFGGSFDPVHTQHCALVKAAISALSLDKVVVIPSFCAPHKKNGAFASGKARLEACRIAFAGEKRVEVSDFELQAGGTSYSYLTCEHFAREYAGATLYFLVGADMLEDFFHWKFPERILSSATLAACGRGERSAGELHETFRARFGKDYVEIPFTGERVSSTALRTAIAFGKRPSALSDGVWDYVEEKGLYIHPAILPALALEKETRREHSYRVALMATERARSLNISEEKALLAAALHDCGKYVPLSSPLLQGFSMPEGVPEPVAHQYVGAYLAERKFGICDGEILDAIRFHTSGRADMGDLEKLIFLADMLEEARLFPGVQALRELFYRDLNDCLFAALKQQIDFLHESGKPVYPLTEQAFLWIKNQKRQST